MTRSQNLTPFYGTRCLNCGTELAGNFCSECGQRATDVNLSVKSLVVEFVESLFSLEFGFWQTFKRLVFWPGSLTEEYIIGRRKPYSSPIRLYLVTSLLFFFVVGFFDGDMIEFETDDGKGGQTVFTGQEAMDAIGEHLIQKGTSTSDAELDSTMQEAQEDFPGSEFAKKVLKNPVATQARFLSYLPRAMFLMVPLAGLFFKLAYIRHKRPYLQYLVFALHLHALLYLTMSVSGLVGLIQPEWLGRSLSVLVFASFPINTIRAQRRVFADSWIKAILKAGLVWHVYGFFLLLTIAVVTALTVWRA